MKKKLLLITILMMTMTTLHAQGGDKPYIVAVSEGDYATTNTAAAMINLMIKDKITTETDNGVAYYISLPARQRLFWIDSDRLFHICEGVTDDFITGYEFTEKEKTNVKGTYLEGYTGIILVFHVYADLGLTSGTLWATTNVGALHRYDFGDYFAWGETTAKDLNDVKTNPWGCYKWTNENASSFYKYNTNAKFGTVDWKTKLDNADDAAYVNWGENWRMPTEKELIELCNQCNRKWGTLNGVKGYFFTPKNGKNVELFFPLAGHYEYIYGHIDNYVSYWTSTMCTEDKNNGDRYAYALHEKWENSSSYVVRTPSRYEGLSVRPVRMKSVPTGIGGITTVAAPTGDGSYYTLDGRRLSGKPTQKGIYIVRGRKVVVD